MKMTLMRAAIAQLAVFSATAKRAVPLKHEQTSRKLFIDYSVNSSTVDMSEQVNGTIYVENYIGRSVPYGGVRTQLMEPDCVTMVNNTGTDVEIYNRSIYPGENSSEPYKWMIQVHQDRLEEGLSGLVTFTDPDEFGYYVGEVEFCTLITTSAGGFDVGFYFDTWEVSYDFFNADFANITSIDVNPDIFETQVASNITLSICQCDPDEFRIGIRACVTPFPVQQDTKASFCVVPSIDDASYVRILNFNLNLFAESDAGSITYDPVVLGEDGTWNSDFFTEVNLASLEPLFGFVEVNFTDDNFTDDNFTDDNFTSAPTPSPSMADEDDDVIFVSNIINVICPIAANFYINNIETIFVSGAAFLEFTQFRAEAVFESFSTQVGIEPREDVGLKGVGCFQSLLQVILDFFP